ncbi:hypothetical protein HDR60_05390 [bacterium]|nr:hypothetical protein [bacterium]
MNMDNKKYYIVFTGLFLIFVGFFVYFIDSSKKVENKTVSLTKPVSYSVETVKVVKVVQAEKPKGLPLNYVYEIPNFERSIPYYLGTKRFIEELDNFQIICSGKNCNRQILTGKNATTSNCNRKNNVKIKVVRGDVTFSKNNLKYLKSNTKIVGDLYIRDINFLKIPKNFAVIGNVYVINSDGLTFMGKNFIDGHIFVKGKSSIRALPYDVKLTGQIFI